MGFKSTFWNFFSLILAWKVRKTKTETNIGLAAAYKEDGSASYHWYSDTLYVSPLVIHIVSLTGPLLLQYININSGLISGRSLAILSLNYYNKSIKSKEFVSSNMPKSMQKWHNTTLSTSKRMVLFCFCTFPWGWPCWNQYKAAQPRSGFNMAASMNPVWDPKVIIF